jgi:hypothetical protein
MLDFWDIDINKNTSAMMIIYAVNNMPNNILKFTWDINVIPVIQLFGTNGQNRFVC